MNWAAFGGPEFFIPGGMQMEASCPLSRNFTEWYQQEGGCEREGYTHPSLPPREHLSQNSEMLPCTHRHVSVTREK